MSLKQRRHFWGAKGPVLDTLVVFRTLRPNMPLYFQARLGGHVPRYPLMTLALVNCTFLIRLERQELYTVF